jgi:hypothetical protein
LTGDFGGQIWRANSADEQRASSVCRIVQLNLANSI